MTTANQAGLDPILRRFEGASPDALIPMLQQVQEVEGYLSKEAIAAIGNRLGLPASKIYGVATFYNQFRFKPRGVHHLVICRGTACHVKGSAKVLDEVSRELRLAPGDTSRDEKFSLEVVACMGACGLAPVVNVNGEFHANATPKTVTKIIEECRKENGDGEE